MKTAVLALASIATLSSAAPAAAWERHHGHGGHGSWHGYHGYDRPHVGFYIGAPMFWSAFDYYRREPYPVTQVLVEREPQVVYVQREAPAAQPAAASGGYWYYCPDSKSYYPYAQTCPSGWLQVVPQTSPQGPQ